MHTLPKKTRLLLYLQSRSLQHIGMVQVLFPGLKSVEVPENLHSCILSHGHL